MKLTIAFFCTIWLLLPAKADETFEKSVQQVLQQVSAIKLGKPSNVLKEHFDIDGGLTPINKPRYRYKECPYIKIDVTLSKEHTIESISKPYLETPFFD